MTEEKQGLWAGLSRRARLFAGMLLAISIAFCAFFLIEETEQAAAGFGSIWFLGFLPMALSALICRIADPEGVEDAPLYWSVPVALVMLVIIGAATILGEGVICIVMLSPIWLILGWVGSFTMRAHLQNSRNNRTLNASFLLLPLFAGVVEEQFPVMHDPYVLTRETVIDATPAEIWPYLVTNNNISKTEGKWTISQNIIGMPRPRAASINREGLGAVRTAYWGDHITFDEIITKWEPGKAMGWRFRFTNTSLQDYTDKHIAPDGKYLTVETGGYEMEPINAKQTRLTLRTRFIAKTNVNAYAQLWSELLMGDVEDNILSIIKRRAEARRQS